MSVKIGAHGRGLAYLLGLGAIILAAMDKGAWKIFLGSALILFIIPIFANKSRRR